MSKSSKTRMSDFAANEIRESCSKHMLLALLVGSSTMAYAAMQKPHSIRFSAVLGLATIFLAGMTIFFRVENEHPGSGWSIITFYGRSMVAQSIAMLIVSALAMAWSSVAFALILILIFDLVSRIARQHLCEREALHQKNTASTGYFLAAVTVIQAVFFTSILHFLF